MSVSSHGNDFRELVGSTLKNLESTNTIKDLKENIRIDNQFFAPFIFRINEIQCLIFCTTSARSDRLKSHQWDSWGIKRKLGQKAKSFVILPNNLSSREISVAKKEITRIKEKNYTSMIDSIIFLSELPDFLRQYKKLNNIK